MGLIKFPSWGDIRQMGAKGSSSVAFQPTFQTIEGWNEFQRRLELLHGMGTQGQVDGIIREVHEWEAKQMAGFHQEQEYHEAMKAQELYEKLIGEGK